MLADVVQAVADAMTLLVGVNDIYTWPNPQPAGPRALIVYGVPGESTPEVMTGENGKLVFSCRDLIVLEWGVFNTEGDIKAGSEAAAPVADAVRMLVWQQYSQDNFRQTITILHTANISDFGQAKWGSQSVFAFRMLLDVTHGVELD